MESEIERENEIEHEKLIMAQGDLLEDYSFKPELTISTNTTNSALRGVVFHEHIDMALLSSMVNKSTLLRTKPDDRGVVEKTLLADLLQSTKDGVLKVMYASSTEHGRIYPTGHHSLGPMRRLVRHALSANVYYDLDMVNAQPSILRAVCERQGINHNMLKEYCNRRDEIICLCKSIGMDREQTKTLFISMINGGNPYTTIPSHCDASAFNKKLGHLIGAFHLEMFQICDQLAQRNPVLNERFSKGKRNQQGAFISKYLQMYEMRILELVVEFGKTSGVIDDKMAVVLCHDGIMIPKSAFASNSTGSLSDFLRRLNVHLEEITGLQHIQFISKPMEQGSKIFDDLRRQNVDWTVEYVDPFFHKYGVMHIDPIVESCDKKILRLFRHSRKDEFATCGDDIFRRNAETGLYREIDMNEVCEEIDDHFTEYEEHIVTKQGVHMAEDKEFLDSIEPKHKAYAQSLRLMATRNGNEIQTRAKLTNGPPILTLAKTLLWKYRRPNFPKEADSHQLLLGLDDGVLDVRKYDFRRPLTNEVVTMSVGFPGSTIGSVSEEDMAEVYSIIDVMMPNPACTHFLLKTLSRCLRQRNHEQIGVFFIGEGLNGKGVITDLMESALGEYAGTMTHRYFTQEPHSCMDPELYELRKSRFIMTSEPRQSRPFDSDTFKRLTGRDKIKTRTLYQKKQTSFKMGCMFFMSNHTITFKSNTAGQAMKKRIVAIDFPHTFCEHPTGKSMKQIDPLLKDRIEAGEFRLSMLALLLKYLKIYDKEGLEYRPPEIQAATEAYFEGISPDKSWLNHNLIPQKGCNTLIVEITQLYNQENACNESVKEVADMIRNSTTYKTGNVWCTHIQPYATTTFGTHTETKPKKKRGTGVIDCVLRNPNTQH